MKSPKDLVTESFLIKKKLKLLFILPNWGGKCDDT